MLLENNKFIWEDGRIFNKEKDFKPPKSTINAGYECLKSSKVDGRNWAWHTTNCTDSINVVVCQIVGKDGS